MCAGHNLPRMRVDVPCSDWYILTKFDLDLLMPYCRRRNTHRNFIGMRQTPPNLIRTAQVAELLGCTRGTVHNYLKKGWLKRYRSKRDGSYWYKRNEVLAFRDCEPELALAPWPN